MSMKNRETQFWERIREKEELQKIYNQEVAEIKKRRRKKESGSSPEIVDHRNSKNKNKKVRLQDNSNKSEDSSESDDAENDSRSLMIYNANKKNKKMPKVKNFENNRIFSDRSYETNSFDMKDMQVFQNIARIHRFVMKVYISKGPQTFLNNVLPLINDLKNQIFIDINVSTIGNIGSAYYKSVPPRNSAEITKKVEAIEYRRISFEYDSLIENSKQGDVYITQRLSQAQATLIQDISIRAILRMIQIGENNNHENHNIFSIRIESSEDFLKYMDFILKSIGSFQTEDYKFISSEICGALKAKTLYDDFDELNPNNVNLLMLQDISNILVDKELYSTYSEGGKMSEQVQKTHKIRNLGEAKIFVLPNPKTNNEFNKIPMAFTKIGNFGFFSILNSNDILEHLLEQPDDFREKIYHSIFFARLNTFAKIYAVDLLYSALGGRDYLQQNGAPDPDDDLKRFFFDGLCVNPNQPNRPLIDRANCHNRHWTFNELNQRESQNYLQRVNRLISLKTGNVGIGINDGTGDQVTADLSNVRMNMRSFERLLELGYPLPFSFEVIRMGVIIEGQSILYAMDKAGERVSGMQKTNKIEQIEGVTHIVCNLGSAIRIFHERYFHKQDFVRVTKVDGLGIDLFDGQTNAFDYAGKHYPSVMVRLLTNKEATERPRHVTLTGENVRYDHLHDRTIANQLFLDRTGLQQQILNNNPQNFEWANPHNRNSRGLNWVLSREGSFNCGEWRPSAGCNILPNSPNERINFNFLHNGVNKKFC